MIFVAFAETTDAVVFLGRTVSIGVESVIFICCSRCVREALIVRCLSTPYSYVEEQKHSVQHQKLKLNQQLSDTL